MTWATRAGPAEHTMTSPQCCSLSRKRLLKRIGVRLVHLEACVTIADPGFRFAHAQRPLPGHDLFDAHGDFHGFDEGTGRGPKQSTNGERGALAVGWLFP